MPPEQLERTKEIIHSYALADSPNEPGAQKRRVRFEDIDPRRGDAVSYIAKGTDAAGLTNGLFGDDAATAAPRLRAWASTHGIRQFQFFGSPPVGLWREMRRIPESCQDGAPTGFAEAWQAAQKQGSDRADFCSFWKAIGGKVKRVKDYSYTGKARPDLLRQPERPLLRLPQPRACGGVGSQAAPRHRPPD